MLTLHEFLDLLRVFLLDIKNVKDTEKTPFDTMTMIPKGTLGLCCFYIAQLMTHLSNISSTVYLPVMLQAFWQCYKPFGILQRVAKSQNVYISKHNT